MVKNGEFIEVFVDVPLEICESRDPKGLYVMARKGDILNFTGVTSLYEVPKSPEIHILNSETSIESAVEQVVSYLEDKGFLCAW